MSGVDTGSIRDAVAQRADEIIEWTKALVRFASENRPPHGTEAELQAFIARACRDEGLEVDVFRPDEVDGIEQHPFWLPGRSYPEGRENVVARWAGEGGGRSLLLSGHGDVAPFEPDNWQVCRPYDPVIKDGRLYGRGSADMKGGLAAQFWAVKILRELGFRPAGDILFESVVDEEFASGNGTLAARLRGHNADLAVVAEATCMQLATACFGAFLGSLTVSGRAGMPFVGEAIPNPIFGAARAVGLFGEFQDVWRAENRHPLFAHPGKGLNVLPWMIDSNRPGEFAQMGTPPQVRIRWIVWCHPGLTEEEFYQRFDAFWSKHAESDPALRPFELKLAREYHFVRPWETPADSPAVQAVAAALRDCDVTPEICGAQFSCDLAIYGDVGNMPAILLGPRGSNLHAPDEYVLVEDVLKLTEVYAHLAAQWCR